MHAGLSLSDTSTQPATFAVNGKHFCSVFSLL